QGPEEDPAQPGRRVLYRQLRNRRTRIRIHHRNQQRRRVEAAQPQQAGQRPATDHEALHRLRCSRRRGGSHPQLRLSLKKGTGACPLFTELSTVLVQRPGINWTGRVPRFRPKIGVDLRLSAADELFSRAFALGRHLSLAADERRGTPINWILGNWYQPPTPWAPDFSIKCTSGPCSENS